MGGGLGRGQWPGNDSDAGPRGRGPTADVWDRGDVVWPVGPASGQPRRASELAGLLARPPRRAPGQAQVAEGRTPVLAPLGGPSIVETRVGQAQDSRSRSA